MNARQVSGIASTAVTGYPNWAERRRRFCSTSSSRSAEVEYAVNGMATPLLGKY